MKHNSATERTKLQFPSTFRCCNPSDYGRYDSEFSILVKQLAKSSPSFKQFMQKTDRIFGASCLPSACTRAGTLLRRTKSKFTAQEEFSRDELTAKLYQWLPGSLAKLMALQRDWWLLSSAIPHCLGIKITASYLNADSEDISVGLMQMLVLVP